MRPSSIIRVAALACLLPGCEPSGEALREVRDGQREIRAKLEALEKKIDTIASRPAAPAAQAAADPNKVYDLPVGDSAIRGPKDAPVTLTEFADFQCPFCKGAHDLVKQVLEAYPKQVKFVYKEFPLTQIHQHAMNASKAAVAARNQGKYWEMHDKLFDNAKALDMDSLKKYAGEVGLDVAKWEKDMASPEVTKSVNDDLQLGSRSNVRGTPTMFLNGKLVTKRSLEDVKAAIDELLKKS